MKPKSVYLLLCILGIALPYWEFVPWLVQNGLNLPLFLYLKERGQTERSPIS